MVSKLDKRILFEKNMKEAEKKKKAKPINTKTETKKETKQEPSEE